MDLYGRMIHDVLFPGFEAFRGRPTVGLMRFLDRTQWASHDELHAIQSGFLRRLIRHAYAHTPHYREVMDARGLGPDDIRGPEDLGKLPLLEKEIARATNEARTADAPPYAVIHKATSGSTGQPIMVSFNAESRYWRDATRWRGYGWAGYRPGMKALHFWGVGAVPPKSRLARWKIKADRALNRNLYLDGTPNGDDHLAGVVETIKDFRPDVLVVYSQAGANLARYVNRTRARTWGTIPVICGAERLFDADRAAIVDAFGAAFETYGSREVMLMASECEAHDGLHASMETMIVEVVVREPDGTTRPARAGESGEVVVTDLHNLAAPLIRYVNSDLALARGPVRCECGRFLDRFGPIEGRLTDTLRDGQGRKVSGLVFNVLFASLYDHARQFQAVQHLDGRVTLRIVPSAAELPPAIQALVESWSARYLPGIRLDLERVDDIPAGPAGKRRLVVVERPGDATALS
jgi:phenylacetate-CoA ligase